MGVDKVVLETFTGLKAFCKNRVDCDLAIYTEDARADKDEFHKSADIRAGVIDLTYTELFRDVANKSLQRHSKRATSKEVINNKCGN
jgi:peroxiredoxin family protein